MSVLKIVTEQYVNPDALEKVIDYVFRNAKLIGGLQVDPYHAAEQMHLCKELWFQNNGKQLRHFVVCFNESESKHIYSEVSLEYGAYRACEFYSDEYQIIFGIHRNNHTNNNWHIHFVVNNVSFLTGKRLRENNRHDLELRQYLQSCCLFPTSYMEICYN